MTQYLRQARQGYQQLGGPGFGTMVQAQIIKYVVLFCVIASVVVGVYFLARHLIEAGKLTPNSKNVGQECTESFECIGYKAGSGPACCLDPETGKKTCTQKVQNALGLWYCPNEADLGTKEIEESCLESSECKGYTFGSGRPGNACCVDPEDGKKKCLAKVKDHVGSFWCPAEAVKPAGTVQTGQSCRESSECAGYTFGKGEGNIACCLNKCTPLVRDIAGNYYCPHEAVKPTGTVRHDQPDNYCRESSECAGYVFGKGEGNIACCLNKCTPLVKDLAGNWYCPHEATGQKGIGASCAVSNECKGYKEGSGPACCYDPGTKKWTCTEKKRDYLGNWYCPNECVGAFLGKAGTC